MGGYVAWYLAEHHPEKANAVFTLATKFLWTPAIVQQYFSIATQNFLIATQSFKNTETKNNWFGLS